MCIFSRINNCRAVKYNVQSDASHKFERGVDPTIQKNFETFPQIVADHKIRKAEIFLILR